MRKAWEARAAALAIGLKREAMACEGDGTKVSMLLARALALVAREVKLFAGVELGKGIRGSEERTEKSCKRNKGCTSL